jgi:hypothetical protein
LVCLLLAMPCRSDKPAKPRPTVGILTLTTKSLVKQIAKQYENELLSISPDIEETIQNASFIAESYVQWLQGADLKAVPLNIHLDDETMMAEIEKFDALLLTGGSQPFYIKSKDDHRNLEDQSSNSSAEKIPDEYLVKVSKIIKKVKQINDEKRKYPLWSTCLGFEATLITDSNFTLTRHEVDNELKAPLPINIYSTNTKSTQFFTKHEREIFDKKNLFYFNHKFGLLLNEVMSNKYLKDSIVPVATINKNGKEILAWYEYVNYPFIGCQFHPEKFEAKVDKDYETLFQKNINHKMALLLKSLIESNSNYLNDASNDEEFETEGDGEDTHFDLYNIGMYNHINFYVRTNSARA